MWAQRIRLRKNNRVALTFAALVLLFASSATASDTTILEQQKVVPLPGKLDATPVFNSNSPEVVRTAGILLSTFPAGRTQTGSDLDYPLQGRFDIFFHHIDNGISEHDYRTLYIGCLVGNASSRKVRVRLLHASSYLSQPDAPFIELPPQVANPNATTYAGPGDRVALDFLRGKTQRGWRPDLTLTPGETRLLFCLPIPVSSLGEPLNGRSGLVQLDSSGPVYLATLSLFGSDPHGNDAAPPSLEAWQQVLAKGVLAGRRDVVPTPPEVKTGIKYGRVAGVDRGAVWNGTLTDPDSNIHILPVRIGETISFAVSTVAGGTLGTDQIQSAPMLVRYPDTAYQAHGNYGVLYDLTIPLRNESTQRETVAITLQSPIKSKSDANQLVFYDKPPRAIFFRGTVRVRFRTKSGKWRDEYVHLVEKQGEKMDPIVSLTLNPDEQRKVRLSFVYPADATPPQVITISGTAAPTLNQD